MAKGVGGADGEPTEGKKPSGSVYLGEDMKAKVGRIVAFRKAVYGDDTSEKDYLLSILTEQVDSDYAAMEKEIAKLKRPPRP